MTRFIAISLLCLIGVFLYQFTGDAGMLQCEKTHSRDTCFQALNR